MIPLGEQHLNVGLDLAMAWGPDWQTPIIERLRAQFPELDDETLAEADRVCRGVMRAGHAMVLELAARDGGGARYEEFRARAEATWPWISAGNLGHLFSQGMYYAWKEGAF